MQIAPWEPGNAIPADEQVILSHTWDEIRRLMWNYVGIVRSDRRLKRALRRITAIQQELDEYYWDYQISSNLLEVRNLALVARLTIQCALARKESRGIHYTTDYLHTELKARDTILR
jgi:L-aspartate oxidase